MEAKKFKNFTNTDFTWKWNGIPYTFPANSEIYLPAAEAEHFAKHLIDRELNTKGVITSNQTARKELWDKCFTTTEVVTPLEALNIEEKKKEGKKKVKKAEVEFPDLADNEE